MYCKERKKKFRSDPKILKFDIFENLLHKNGLKGGISIDADSGPPNAAVVFVSSQPLF